MGNKLGSWDQKIVVGPLSLRLELLLVVTRCDGTQVMLLVTGSQPESTTSQVQPPIFPKPMEPTRLRMKCGYMGGETDRSSHPTNP